MMILLSGKMSDTGLAHSIIMILFGIAKFSFKSSDIMPGSWRR